MFVGRHCRLYAVALIREKTGAVILYTLIEEPEVEETDTKLEDEEVTMLFRLKLIAFHTAAGNTIGKISRRYKCIFYRSSD